MLVRISHHNCEQSGALWICVPKLEFGNKEQKIGSATVVLSDESLAWTRFLLITRVLAELCRIRSKSSGPFASISCSISPR